MKLHFRKAIVLCTLLTSCATAVLSQSISSPNGNIRLTAGCEGGKPYYTLSYNNKQVVKKSFLGLEFTDKALLSDLKIVGKQQSAHDETWEQPWGEDREVRNSYNELTVKLQEKGKAKRKMDIVFRVFDDGFGFRYVIPRQKGIDSLNVAEELTEFTLAHDAQAWSIPSNHTEYFEGIFKRALLSQKDTVCTPLTIEYEPDLYLAIHEAALTDYASQNLTPRSQADGSITLREALTPWRSGMKVYAKGSLTSPWRTMILAKRPGDLITSRLMLNLNEPSTIEDTSWIEPGRYIGVWWSIHKKQNTWEMGPNHGATTANVKRYIDFAARHGFSGVLAEGWNPGWEQGEKVTYLKAYPDFDIDDVCQYAARKGVRFIGHMESWGNARLIENEMDSAFAWFNRLGIRAVKTGYVGHLLDGKELAKSQYGIRHYRKVVECAARHQIMIDNHEPAMPTGLQRTLPNFMTQEGVRGQEYNAWSRDGGNPPAHTVTLPFTRGLAGPTDFTPAIFNFDEIVEGTHPHSTLAKQLAEFVVIYSPLQMAADAIENYEGQPALSFIETCPTTWEKTIVPSGEIGRYITMARKERNGDSWFVAAMTNEESRQLSLSLDFLDDGATYEATIYEDAADADYENNPYAMTIRRITADKNTMLSLKLARSGGMVARITKK